VAKKKKFIDLKNKNIEYFLDNIQYKIESFNPNSMTVTLLRLENDTLKRVKDFPFAHLPKEIKKIIKPN